MMDFFRQWLRGVVACALFVGILRQLCPQGAARQIARFAGALALLCAMLQPLQGEITFEYALDTGAYREALSAAQEELALQRRDTLADGIAAGLAAYIEDKAAQRGMTLCAEVTMRQEGTIPLPDEVILSSAYDAAFSDWIAEELGIAKERQTWNGNG